MKAAEIRTQESVAKRTKSKENPNRSNSNANIPPVSSSTRGYLAEILSPQYLHFPPRKTKLSTGIKSSALRRFPQLPQLEGGDTIDLLLGSL